MIQSFRLEVTGVFEVENDLTVIRAAKEAGSK
jgi:hypothetical protein